VRAGEFQLSKTYATGDVSATGGNGELPFSQPETVPGVAVGSIVGMNYYVEATTGRAPKIEYSVGLSLLIKASAPSGVPTFVHRVAGNLGPNVNGVVNDNYGYEDMVGVPAALWVSDLDGLDGEDCVRQPSGTFYSGSPLNWSLPGIWSIGSDGYPVLN
jgi:hypothetical protein